jgi:hypothetical protein
MTGTNRKDRVRLKWSWMKKKSEKERASRTGSGGGGGGGGGVAEAAAAAAVAALPARRGDVCVGGLAVEPTHGGSSGSWWSPSNKLWATLSNHRLWTLNLGPAVSAGDSWRPVGRAENVIDLASLRGILFALDTGGGIWRMKLDSKDPRWDVWFSPAQAQTRLPFTGKLQAIGATEAVDNGRGQTLYANIPNHAHTVSWHSPLCSWLTISVHLTTPSRL